MSGVVVFPPWVTSPASMTPAVLVGVEPATLQAWLTDAQTALHQMMLSNQPQSVTYGQGDGQKTVTFNRSSVASLQSWIGMLQQALGVTRGRRAIAVRFGR